MLPVPARTGSNYRDYSTEHVDRLQFIARCRSLDMELDEIRALLRLKDAPVDSCAGVDNLLDAHIGHVTERVRELKALALQLNALRVRCGQAQETSRCGILQELFSGGGGAAIPVQRHKRGLHR